MTVSRLSAAICVFVVGCGNDSFSSSTADGGSEGSAPDGGAAEASTLDGGTGDANPGPFCTSFNPPPLFCADFDKGGLLAGYESGALRMSFLQDVYGPSTLAVAPTGKSEPNALDTTTGALAPAVGDAGEALAKALVTKTFSSTASHFHLTFEMRLDAYVQPLDPKGQLTFLSMYIKNGSAQFFAHLDLINIGGQIAGNTNVGDYYQTQPFAFPPAGPDWIHVDFDLKLSFAAAHFEVSFDGKNEISADVATPGIAAGSFLFNLGLSSDGPLNPAHVSYDNVVYTED